MRKPPRDDVRPNLRITNYRRRTVIAFEVDEAGRRIAILGVFYGGRNYESALGGAIDWQSSPDHR